MDFQSEKSFGKLRLRAFQPYHPILCILKHVRDVRDQILCMSETSEMDCVWVSHGYTNHHQGRGHSIRPTATLINIHEHLI